MKNLLYKELKLSSSPLSYAFLAAAFLTFLPGYPILVGAFFITLGIFYSFQSMRENNDLNYSLLLPVAKKDFVKGKFDFCLFIEGCGFALTAAVTIVRMLFLKSAAVYTSNALMCANLSSLGFTLLVFGVFNLIFVGGFFKTAYYFGKPFILYSVAALIIVTGAETLWHIPGFGGLNSFGFDNILPQAAVLFIGIAAFLLLTVLSFKISVKRFEKNDL